MAKTKRPYRTWSLDPHSTVIFPFNRIVDSLKIAWKGQVLALSRFPSQGGFTMIYSWQNKQHRQIQETEPVITLHSPRIPARRPNVRVVAPAHPSRLGPADGFSRKLPEDCLGPPRILRGILVECVIQGFTIMMQNDTKHPPSTESTTLVIFESEHVSQVVSLHRFFFVCPCNPHLLQQPTLLHDRQRRIEEVTNFASLCPAIPTRKQS